ncbi:amidase signature domain-containing protein [Sordaria brevicollis]|uniref:amidase n=1 Tax=Sordaria brevicollis TaxID=83679 RepID=A0AAE0PDT9_SORBR|nr:amidase signature domain-containing protein [Sordaria brevicollis]
MSFLTDYVRHKRDCKSKQAERQERIASLSPEYHSPLSEKDLETINKPITDLVSDIHHNVISPLSVLRTYGKVAVKAHAKTNCLTEVLVSAAETSLTTKKDINLEGPLAGIPVSLKDTIIVGGFDTTVGYSSFAGNKSQHPVDGPMVRLLKDAGAVPYVKTNLPISLLSYESTNDLWGRCTNPYNAAYSPGGSTGGESALLACGGRIGIGSDVAGSVRVPAHYSGCYSLRCATGRWPKAGILTSMPGQEGVPSVYSPMARTLEDLRYFSKAVIEMEPWKYDHSVHPLAWREEVVEEFANSEKKLRVGVLRTDKVVDPSPACKRALETVEEALRREGHEIVEMDDAPDMFEALRLGALLLNADGGWWFNSYRRFGEWLDTGASLLSFGKWPSIVRYLSYLWVRYVRRDNLWAELVRQTRPISAAENWGQVKKREAYRAEWFEYWNRKQFDVLISAPNALPAIPKDASKDTFSNCGYCFLFNLLDYTAGVIPVTHVNSALDKLPSTFNHRKLHGIAARAYKYYDAERMHGLPVGVQIVGRRLEEEKVLAVMKRVEDALGENKYKLFDPKLLEVD